MKNILLIAAVVGLAVVGCHSPRSSDVKIPENFVITDTIFASQTDSLAYLVEKEIGSPFERMRICNELSYSFTHNDVKKSIYYGKLGLSLSANEKNEKKD